MADVVLANSAADLTGATLAKVQNASANSKLVGSGASGSGSPYTEITLGTNLSMSGTTLNASGGGTSGLVLVDTQTAASSSSIEFTGLSSTYSNYLITLENVVIATSGQDLVMTWSDAGGYFSANYQWINFYRGTTVALGSTTSASAANLKIAGTVSNSRPTQGQMTLINTQASSGYASFTGDTNTWGTTNEMFWGNVSGAHALTAALTKVKFTVSSGNITTGIFRLYGISKV